jgi:hypothetical protein
MGFGSKKRLYLMAALKSTTESSRPWTTTDHATEARRIVDEVSDTLTRYVGVASLGATEARR